MSKVSTDLIERPPARPGQPVGSRVRFASLRAVVALMLREMYTSYGRSPGGYLWAVLEPAAGIAILTIILSFAFVSPPLGTSFAMFYATGMVPFLAFSDVSGKVAQTLHYSKPLLTYPSVTFVDAIIARFILNMLTQIFVSFIVFGGLLAFVQLTSGVDYVLLAQSLVMVGALSLSIGTLNTFLVTRFPVWQRVWGIVMRPMFVLSCIFFLFETIPQPFRDYLWYNPLVHIVGQMRSAFYSTYDASYVSATYVYLFSLIVLVFALNLLSRYHRDLLND